MLSSDFDADGDVDVAVSAYFPNFEASDPRALVYLENTGTDAIKFVPQKVGAAGRG